MVGDRPEQPLSGGKLNQVVRAGDTVRRRAGPWSAAIQALLGHLQESGFTGAPRPLGFDAQGREVLSYLKGAVEQPPFPAYVTSDVALAALAHLLRHFHDAQAGFVPPADVAWQYAPGAPTSGPVICHNDLATWNVLFRNQAPAAMIDFDLAAPAPRLWDVVYVAWRWVPLYGPQSATRFGLLLDLPARLRRLALFAAAYGLTVEEREAFLDTLHHRMQVSHDTIATWGSAGRPGYHALFAAGLHLGPLADQQWLNLHWQQLSKALRAE